MSEKKGQPETDKFPTASNGDALQTLGDKLEAKRRLDADKRKFDEGNSGMAVGFKYATEFSAAVLVSAALGYGVDKWLETSPWGLLVGLILGFAAGVMNVIRAAKEGMGGDLGTDLPETETDE